MSDKYVVHVAAPAEGEEESVAARLAEVLGFEPKKIDAILRRLPDVVTKPVPRSEAEKVAGRFQQAGLSALVLPAGTSERRKPSGEVGATATGSGTEHGSAGAPASATAPGPRREPADPPPASSDANGEPGEAGSLSDSPGNADAPAEAARGSMPDPAHPSEPETPEEFTYRQTAAGLTGVSIEAAGEESADPLSGELPDEGRNRSESNAATVEERGRDDRRSGWLGPLLVLVAVALAVLAYLYLLD